MMFMFVVVLPKFQVLYDVIMFHLLKEGLKIANLEEVKDSETFYVSTHLIYMYTTRFRLYLD